MISFKLGPLASRLITQLISCTEWGDLGFSSFD